ncbi:MAG: hypothetical protein AAFP97_08245 [Pseudomonadota bacterium]
MVDIQRNAIQRMNGRTAKRVGFTEIDRLDEQVVTGVREARAGGPPSGRPGFGG